MIPTSTQAHRCLNWDSVCILRRHRGEMCILHTETARVTFWVCFTLALNCVGFLGSMLARHTSSKDLPLYHSECARAPATQPSIFKYMLPLSLRAKWSHEVALPSFGLFICLPVLSGQISSYSSRAAKLEGSGQGANKKKPNCIS